MMNFRRPVVKREYDPLIKQRWILEFAARFAPYVGIVRERKVRRQRGIRGSRRRGSDLDDTRLVAGVQVRF